MNAYSPADTALLLIDPYNDFLSPGGKLAGHAQAVAEEVRTVENMRALVKVARGVGITVFYVPHHRALPSDFSGWKHASPYQLGGHRLQVFAQDSWGGEWHPDFKPQDGDVIVREHWSASGFANTDLDVQLKQRGLGKIIVIGMLANTCVETTAKYGAELGYHVTLVRDATAAFSSQAMHSAHELNGPTFAHEILTTMQVVDGLNPPGLKKNP